MNRTLYTLLLYLLSPIIWLYFIYRGFSDPRYLSGIKQRLGILPEEFIAGGIHIHCASVGETLAAKPLIEKIADKYPQSNIVITTTTPTGRDEVLKLIENINHSNMQHCYLPIDWIGACKRFINKIKPNISVLMETELWPNLLNQLSKKNIPILLANARLSDSSLKKYQKHLKLSEEIFASLSLISAQYEADKNSFQRLGVVNNKIELIGSIKFDIQFSDKLIQNQQQLKHQWTADRPSWIAASIHPAEFKAILNTHKKLLEFFPDLLLIAVPRHPEFFDALKQNCKKQDLAFICRSDNQSPTKEHCVLIGDSMGELTLMCGAADIAFVGGSLIERGGHNPLEPAACGLPVIMGESYYNFSDVCQIMQDSETLEIVNDEEGLFTSIKALLSNPELLTTKSQAAKNIFAANRGAVDKIMLSIEKLLNI